jgi:ketosteroid isomerase-like protein
MVDALARLMACDQIRQLAHRYALAVDGKDVDGVAALFVEDVDNGRYGPGREGVKTFYDDVLRNFHCSMHLVGNHVIDFDDDTHAHGVVYCRAQHHVLEPDHWFDQALAYWDTYELVDDEWLFRRRRLKSWYRQEIGHPEHGNERLVSDPAATGSMRGAQMPEEFPTFEEFWSRAPCPLPSDGS